MSHKSGHKKLSERGRLRIVFLLPSFSQNKDDRICIKISNASMSGAVFSFVTKSKNAKRSILLAVVSCVASSTNCNAELNKNYRLSYRRNRDPIKMNRIKY